ncbi:DUF6090 family protein [Robiginitalea sp. IMCC44478]|uniref:DUF6090 family protein n=1 Tax=Robiginitalea sp. IMCC44478 TaxID=3459122 RepID=UPI0040419E7B
MLRFFRLLRQKLLSQNLVRKYLFYAIGEIVLVVIGILIALAINNWNEKQKLREYEEDILKEIRTGLVNTREEVLRSIEEDLRWRACNYKILEYLDQQKPYDESLDPCFGSYFWSSTLQLTTSAYDELKVRGLELISNPELRRELTDMFDYKFDVIKSEVEVWDSELLSSTIYPMHVKLFRKYYPESWQVFEDEFAKPVDYQSLLSNEAYKNLLAEIISLRNYSIVINQSLEKDLQHLIGSIDKELKALSND